jgi:hypothetical protein
MGLRDRLARLDAVVVPRLGRGARRLAGLRPASLARPASWAVPGVAVIALATVGVTLLAHHRATPTSQVAVPVGVSDGDSIPDYLAAGRAELSDLRDTAADRPIYALTSFATYLTPTQVATVVAATGDLAPVTASARVPLPHRQTELVRLGANRLPDDLVTAMLDVSDRKIRDAADDAARAAASPGPVGAQAASNAAVEAAEAQQYRTQCACVYALVVRATPVTLTRLAKRPEVRGIEPAPQLSGVTGVTFRAPLPEQTDVVLPPDDDAMPVSPPTPTPAVAASPSGSPSVTPPTATPADQPSASPTRTDGPVSTG